MKKFLVNLSVICLLAALMVPMVGCKKEEPAANDALATDMAPVEPVTTEPTSTELSTDLAPVSTDLAPVSTDVTPLVTDGAAQ